MHDAALHPAGDRDELAGDVAGQALRSEDDDLRGDVLGHGDLAERHRACDPADVVLLEQAARHRRRRPARRDGVHPDARTEPRGLVLQREEQAALDRGFRRGVVRVPRLPEAARSGADEDERAAPALGDPSEKGARGEEGRGEVGGER
jgi:hypothetical protein